ncbi:hypothetical protein V8G54_035027 [Vigna mungo]|uniref:Uncharacterized protein n=1 Tax=Vigna mungo TaxID=3915 RepID=A0AAQ3MEY8_VIGMU
MAFSDRGSLLQAPPNLYKVLLAFSQPPVAYVVVGIPTCTSLPPTYLRIQRSPLDVALMLWLQESSGSRFINGFKKKVGFGGSLISTPPMLIRLGPWSSVSGLSADKISEIDQPAGWVGLAIPFYESVVCAREGLTFLTHIQSYRHGPTDLFSIGASSSATRFYLTKPRARPRREFALPNSLFDNKAETPDPTFISFE